MKNIEFECKYCGSKLFLKTEKPCVHCLTVIGDRPINAMVDNRLKKYKEVIGFIKSEPFIEEMILIDNEILKRIKK